MNVEIWKDIPGILCYEASNFGNIRSVDRTIYVIGGSPTTRKGKILSKKVNKQGREEVSIHGKSYLVHRLVALAFIPNPNKLSQINHKDENPLNNNVDNLEWCDCYYNNTYNNRHITVGNKQAKPVYQYDRKGNLIKKWNNGREASKALSISRSGIRNACCCVDGYNAYKNYIWSYTLLKEEELV